jgi:hypothetical protein
VGIEQWASRSGHRAGSAACPGPRLASFKASLEGLGTSR